MFVFFIWEYEEQIFALGKYCTSELYLLSPASYVKGKELGTSKKKKKAYLLASGQEAEEQGGDLGLDR